MEILGIILMVKVVSALWILSAICILFRNQIAQWVYKRLFLPQRAPDLITPTLEMYWFDEKIAVCQKLGRTGRHKFVEVDGMLYWGKLKTVDYSQEPIYGVSSVVGVGLFPPSIQEAYTNHINVKFEQILLGHQDGN